MPRLKMDEDEFNIKELEGAEYDDSREGYTDYSGEIPPKGTVLPGKIKKAWWTFNNSKPPARMMIAIWEADENAGEYEGLPLWDYISFSPQAKWRWQPFLDATGLTLRDFKKMEVEDEDDERYGTPIISIGDWEVGEDSAAVNVVTKRERYDGDWRAKVDKYLPYDADEDAGEDEDEDEDEDYEDEEWEEEPDEDEDEEEEEQPAAPKRATRAAKATAKPAATRSAAKPTRPAPSTSATRTRGTAKPARPTAAARSAASSKSGAAATRRAANGKVASKPATKPTARRRRGADDDPPF